MIRELRNEDVPGLVRLLRAVHVDFVNTEAAVRHNLAGDTPAARRRFWVAEADGEIVGRARASFEIFSSEQGTALVNISVHPARRRRRLGSALYALAEEHLIAEGARRILATADQPAGRPFLEAHGFRHTHTTAVSKVRPAAIDLAELAKLEAARAEEGLRLVPLASVRGRPRDVFELHVAALADVPSDTPFDDIDYDDWLRTDWSFPSITDEGSFVVLDGERPVSIAFLVADLEGRRAANAMTGTLRDFRGRGLARLVKLAAIRWAAAQGIERIVAHNDATNAAMLRVNRRLGYEPYSEHWSYVKQL